MRDGLSEHNLIDLVEHLECIFLEVLMPILFIDLSVNQGCSSLKGYEMDHKRLNFYSAILCCCVCSILLSFCSDFSAVQEKILFHVCSINCLLINSLIFHLHFRIHFLIMPVHLQLMQYLSQVQRLLGQLNGLLVTCFGQGCPVIHGGHAWLHMTQHIQHSHEL